MIDTVKEWGKTDISDPIQQAIFRASRQYAQNYEKRHGTLKVLGMPEPIPLEEVYTQVRLLSASEIRLFDSIERDPIYEGLHPGLEKELLAAIAYPSFKEDRLFVERDDIVAEISKFLADTLDAPKSF